MSVGDYRQRLTSEYTKMNITNRAMVQINGSFSVNDQGPPPRGEISKIGTSPNGKTQITLNPALEHNDNDIQVHINSCPQRFRVEVDKNRQEQAINDLQKIAKASENAKKEPQLGDQAKELTKQFIQEGRIDTNSALYRLALKSDLVAKGPGAAPTTIETEPDSTKPKTPRK